MCGDATRERDAQLRLFAPGVGAAQSLAHPFDDGFGTTAPVGSLQANPFGLHDMLGNVSAWCRDLHGGYEERRARPGAGMRGSESGSSRALRGGSSALIGRERRGAFRQWLDRGTPAFSIGVRPARRLR